MVLLKIGRLLPPVPVPFVDLVRRKIEDQSELLSLLEIPFRIFLELQFKDFILFLIFTGLAILVKFVIPSLLF